MCKGVHVCLSGVVGGSASLKDRMRWLTSTCEENRIAQAGQERWGYAKFVRPRCRKDSVGCSLLKGYLCCPDNATVPSCVQCVEGGIICPGWARDMTVFGSIMWAT